MCFAGEHRNDRTSTIPIVFSLFGFIIGSPPSLARFRLSGRRRSFAGTALGLERIGACDRATLLAFRYTQGYQYFMFATDTALLAPAKTPPEIVKWIEKETLKVLSAPETQAKLYKAAFLVRPKGGDAAWARIIKEITMFKAIIDQAGIKKL